MSRIQLWLTMVVLGREAVTYVLPPMTSVMVGRDESANDIVLHHANVSRTHARLVARGDGYTVMDLASTKGTHVNGERVVSGRLLADGDRLTIGPYEFVIGIRPWTHADEEDVEQTLMDTQPR